MTTRSRFLTGLTGSAAFVAVPALVRAQSRTLKVGFVPSTLFAPLFVAQERGYLTAAGFDCELSPIVAGQDALVLAAQGNLDFIAAGISAAFYNAVNRGLDVRFVASTGYQPAKGHPTALMIRQDLFESGLKSPKDLKGKKIGWIGGAGATSSYYVARILREVGLKLSDVEGTNIANADMEVALTKKAIDGAFLSAPFTSIFEEKKLAHIIGSVHPGIAGTGIFFGPSMFKVPAVAKGVMGALRKAAAEIAGAGYYHPENLEAYAKYTKQPIELIKKADRYDFKPDLHVDRTTVLDIQNEFIYDGFIKYAALPAQRLIAAV